MCRANGPQSSRRTAASKAGRPGACAAWMASSMASTGLGSLQEGGCKAEGLDQCAQQCIATTGVAAAIQMDQIGAYALTHCAGSRAERGRHLDGP